MDMYMNMKKVLTLLGQRDVSGQSPLPSHLATFCSLCLPPLNSQYYRISDVRGAIPASCL